MFLLLAAGIFFIIVGVGMLVMPNAARRLDRFENSVRGLESRQGDAYEIGRIVRSLALIAAGVAILLMPILFLR